MEFSNLIFKTQDFLFVRGRLDFLDFSFKGDTLKFVFLGLLFFLNDIVIQGYFGLMPLVGVLVQTSKMLDVIMRLEEGDVDLQCHQLLYEDEV
jgi:hypothetical protein